MAIRTIFYALALVLLSSSAAQAQFGFAVDLLYCGAGPVTFDEINFFDEQDESGNGTVWGTTDDCGLGNFTGGQGKAACVQAGINIPEFETSLESNEFSLKGLSSASVRFRLNYQDLIPGISDRLEVQVREGNGIWQNLAAYITDVGTDGGPGVLITINLNILIGKSDLELRWRYYDNSVGNDSGRYVQIDDIELICEGGADLEATLSSPVETVLEGTPIDMSFGLVNKGPFPTDTTLFIAQVAPGFVIDSYDLVPLVPFVSMAFAEVMKNRLNFGTDVPIVATDGFSLPFNVRAGILPEAIFEVTSPTTISGTYESTGASFGPQFPFGTPIQGALVLGEDPDGSANDGCTPLTNSDAVAGNIAMLSDTSTCDEDEQVFNAQEAGATAVVIIGGSADEVSGLPKGLQTAAMVTTPITIPSLRISESDGNLLLGQIVNSISVRIQGIEVLAQKQTSFSFTYGSVYDPDFDLTTVFLGTLSGSDMNNLMTSSVTVLRDTDGDGTADIDDECRFDASKIVPGACGCGNEDIDADNSGIVDCLIADEIKVDLQSLLTAITSLKKLKDTQGNKKKKAARALKKAAKSLLSGVFAKIGTNAQSLSISNSSVSVQEASDDAEKQSKRALRIKRKAFKKLKKKAIAALQNLIDNLA